MADDAGIVLASVDAGVVLAPFNAFAAPVTKPLITGLTEFAVVAFCVEVLPAVLFAITLVAFDCEPAALTIAVPV